MLGDPVGLLIVCVCGNIVISIGSEFLLVLGVEVNYAYQRCLIFSFLCSKTVLHSVVF